MNRPNRISRFVTGLALVAAGAAALSPAAATAQTSRSAFSIVGGGSVHGDLTPGYTSSTTFEPGWIAGLQAEWWLGSGRTGLRLNGLGTQRMLETGPGDYNVISADLDLMVRLLPVRPDRRLAPYVAAGVGAVNYHGVASSPALAGGAFGGEPVLRAAALLALGTDLLTAGGNGLRIEVADQLVFPSIGEGSLNSDGLITVHNLVATAGVRLGFGRLGPTVVVQSEPAPAPGRGDAQFAARDPEAREAVDADPSAPALYTVQVGSFVEAATADRWAARLRARSIPVWLTDTTIQGEPVSRMRVGVLQSESEAHSLAAALERDYNWPVWVDRVAPGEAYPAEAILDTRQFLYGQ